MSEEQTVEVRRLASKGNSLRQIAAQTGLSKSAVQRHLKVGQSGTASETVAGREEAPVENGGNGGNGHTEPEPVTDRLTADELQRRVRVICDSEDPAVILPFLAKLQSRSERLTTLLERERANKQSAERAIEKYAVAYAESDDDPVLEQKLTQARTDAVAATSLIAAGQRELAALSRPIAELVEASERRAAGLTERQQNQALQDAHALIEKSQREFLRHMDTAVELLHKAGEIGKQWNKTARSYRLPTEFNTKGIDYFREHCASITALTSKGEPVASVKVRLPANVNYQGKSNCIVTMPAFQAKFMVEEAHYGCTYADDPEQ